MAVPDQEYPETPPRANDDLAALHDKIDSLWISYLAFLDQYEKAQNEISKHFSRGFFSLTQANFSSPSSGRGRRFGQDSYDERTRTSKHINIVTSDIDGKQGVELKVTKTEAKADALSGDSALPDTSDAHSSTKEEQTQQSSPTPTPLTDTNVDISKLSLHSHGPTEDSREPPPKRPKDPIQWFGILVPRELRSAQTFFSAAVDGSIANAANAARGMREIETEIRKLRKTAKKAGRELNGSRKAG